MFDPLVLLFHIIFLSITICSLSTEASKTNPAQISLKVFNNCDFAIELFYVRDANNLEELAPQTKHPIRKKGGTASILSYDTHKFIVKAASSVANGRLDDPRIQAHVENIFSKRSREETVNVTYNASSERFIIVQRTIEDDIRESVSNATIACRGVAMENMEDCVANQLIDFKRGLETSKKDLQRFHRKLADKAYRYICNDTSMKTHSVVDRPFHVTVRDLYGTITKRSAKSLLDKESSKIWTIDNFVSSEECSALIRYAQTKLEAAPTFEDDTVKRSRQAKQATYIFNRNTKTKKYYTKSTDEEEMIYNLYNRVLSVSSGQTGRSLQPGGQEDFSIIRYHAGEFYAPHCDGTCNGSPYNSGGRVATALLYCQEPDLGGLTVFPSSDIYVKPKTGSALFFSYAGQNGFMDSEYTLHAGCPVIKGEKWVVTAWMRDGISSTNPWSNYDAHGNPFDLDIVRNRTKSSSASGTAATTATAVAASEEDSNEEIAKDQAEDERSQTGKGRERVHDEM